MESLILLVPLSLVAIGVAVAFFFRMNASGQFDDDVGPAWSVLMDDDRPADRVIEPPGIDVKSDSLDSDQGAVSGRRSPSVSLTTDRGRLAENEHHRR